MCVTDDVDAARATAAEDFAVYGTLPSYRAMLDREQASGPGDVALVGDEAAVTEQIAALDVAGATEFVASIYGDPRRARPARSRCSRRWRRRPGDHGRRRRLRPCLGGHPRRRGRGDGRRPALRHRPRPRLGIGDKPNGGYLLATMARAAVAAAADDRGPSPAAPDLGLRHVHRRRRRQARPQVQVEILRRGRRMSQARAPAGADGASFVEATFTLGRLVEASEPWWSDAAGPRSSGRPRSASAVQGAGPTGIRLPIMDRVDIRLDPAATGFRAGRPGGVGELRARLRFRDGQGPDPAVAAVRARRLPAGDVRAGHHGLGADAVPHRLCPGVARPRPLLVRQRARSSRRDRSTRRATCGTAGAGSWPRPPSSRASGSAMRVAPRAGAP